MIELEKQQEPTTDEVQEWVNQVYEYAADLYINQNKSWGEVENELVKQGLNDEDASAIVLNLKEQEREEKKDASNKELGYGILWAGGGIALTAITGGTFIFYGAVLYGGWLILKGFWHKIG